MHVSRRRIAFAQGSLVVAGMLLAAACARHEANPAFRRSISIGDRGISVPLPPPSLTAEPEQEVDVEADAIGDDPVLAGTVVHVEDVLGEGIAELELAADAERFVVEGVLVDLRANCLEVWLVAPDGRESDHALVHAVIVPDDDDEDSLESIVTVAGCE